MTEKLFKYNFTFILFDFPFKAYTKTKRSDVNNSENVTCH